MKKRSVKISGHLTSVSLEEEFWRELKTLAKAEKLSLNALIAKIDKQRSENLSSALRLYVLKSLKKSSLQA
ncbi:MAG: aryl-sulfate sulfotransferase [Alphaproteobacteria bacterium PRO2]|nr:aryl-sulfate sulfotransferase [Alphaproteobacteria bacterium PRO2]